MKINFIKLVAPEIEKKNFFPFFRNEFSQQYKKRRIFHNLHQFQLSLVITLNHPLISNSKMASLKSIFIISFVIAVACLIENASTSPYPSLDFFGGYDIIGVCLKNCAQCKKMFGNFFEGQLCADSCVKFKGKVIPDCEDLGELNLIIFEINFNFNLTKLFKIRQIN